MPNWLGDLFSSSSFLFHFRSPAHRWRDVGRLDVRTIAHVGCLHSELVGSIHWTTRPCNTDTTCACICNHGLHRSGDHLIKVFFERPHKIHHNQVQRVASHFDWWTRQSVFAWNPVDHIQLHIFVSLVQSAPANLCSYDPQPLQVVNQRHVVVEFEIGEIKHPHHCEGQTKASKFLDLRKSFVKKCHLDFWSVRPVEGDKHPRHRRNLAYCYTSFEANKADRCGLTSHPRNPRQQWSQVHERLLRYAAEIVEDFHTNRSNEYWKMLVERYLFPPFHALLIDVVSLYPQWVPPWSNDRIASLKDCSVPTAWVPVPKRLEWPLPDNVPSVEPDVPATLLDVPYAPQAVELKQRQNRKIGFLIIEEPHDEWNHPWCLVESQTPELLVLCWCSWSVCYDNVLRLASAKAPIYPMIVPEDESIEQNPKELGVWDALVGSDSETNHQSSCHPAAGGWWGTPENFPPIPPTCSPRKPLTPGWTAHVSNHRKQCHNRTPCAMKLKWQQNCCRRFWWRELFWKQNQKNRILNLGTYLVKKWKHKF